MPTTTEVSQQKDVDSIHSWSIPKPFVLERGATLPSLTVAYKTYGRLNECGDNAILICHALTANANAADWWGGLVGPGKALDTERYFVVCPNILGSCYGTTGPTSPNPATGEQYGIDFPEITVRDMVRVQRELLEHLGVTSLATVSGSSLGGMQVLEWAVMYPDFCRSIIPISTSARQSSWCIALNSIARAAITSDPDWHGGRYTRQPARGLAIARMVGMASYRSAEEFEARFGRNRRNGGFEVENYLAYQGKKLADRFDANTYLVLSHAVDSHDIGRGRGTIESVLNNLRSRTLCIGVSSDLRYPIAEQQALVRSIPHSRFAKIRSIHGHDAFLIEFDQLNPLIQGSLEEEAWNNPIA